MSEVRIAAASATRENALSQIEERVGRRLTYEDLIQVGKRVDSHINNPLDKAARDALSDEVGRLMSTARSRDESTRSPGAGPSGGVQRDGASGDADIRAVQAKLRALGYDAVGEVDGELGPKTKGALREFQRDHKLPVTGALDGRTRAELQQVQPPTDEEVRANGRELILDNLKVNQPETMSTRHPGTGAKQEITVTKQPDGQYSVMATLSQTISNGGQMETHKTAYSDLGKMTKEQLLKFLDRPFVWDWNFVDGYNRD